MKKYLSGKNRRLTQDYSIDEIKTDYQNRNDIKKYEKIPLWEEEQNAWADDRHDAWNQVAGPPGPDPLAGVGGEAGGVRQVGVDGEQLASHNVPWGDHLNWK